MNGECPKCRKTLLSSRVRFSRDLDRFVHVYCPSRGLFGASGYRRKAAIDAALKRGSKRRNRRKNIPLPRSINDPRPAYKIYSSKITPHRYRNEPRYDDYEFNSFQQKPKE